MAGYVDLDGVRTWYDERGSGEPLVLLHGGLSDSRIFTGNLDTLAERFHVYLPERRGHGHTPDVEGPITIELMTRDTIAFLDKVVGGPARLAGYSNGASIALEVALQRPDLVERLVLVSGVFAAEGMLVKPEPGAPVPEEMAKLYAEVSPDGPEHFPVVVAKIAEVVGKEPAHDVADLARVGCRTLVMTGDDDIVSLEHTVELYRGIPDAELAIVPRATHLLLMEKPELCTRIVGEFLAGEPAPTFMPMRRV